MSYTELLDAFRENHEVGRKWAKKCYLSGVFATETQHAEAEAGSGGAEVRLLTAAGGDFFLEGKESDQAYYLRKKHPELTEKLSAAQQTRVNHCIARELPYELPEVAAAELEPKGVPPKGTAGTEAEAEAATAALGFGKYRLLRKRLLRTGAGLSSAKQGSISTGTVVNVTEQQLTNDGKSLVSSIQ